MNGVSLDDAFNMNPLYKMAMCIVIGELKGRGQFNFNSMSFDEIQ